MSEILLESLASRLGQAVDTLREQLQAQGVIIGTTWDGEPGVPVDIARGVVEKHEERVAELERRGAAYTAYLARRELERKDVGRRAFEDAYAREHARESRLLSGQQADGTFASTSTLVTLSPPGLEAAHEAAELARTDFDRADPLMSAEEFEQEVL